jgi:hypothetical protein
MTTRELYDQMVARGWATREEIDEFFALLSQDTLENQIEMALTPNDYGTEYTTIDGKKIEVRE